MMAITVIHCADLHFDSPFSGLDSARKAEIRREELRQVFGRITNLARTENADALIISGDLFDSVAVSSQTLRYIREKLSQISDIPVFIAAGNHDFNAPGSLYKVFNFGENVHIFSDKIEKIECKGFNLYGVSFTSQEEANSKLCGFCVENPEQINIMAMHADIGGVYNPITKQEIQDSSLDYLALGHIHMYSDKMQFGKTCAVYPGCPEGRGFDELGPKGVVKAVIEKNNVNIEFIPVAKRIYHEITVDVSGAESYDTLCGRILFAMKGSPDDLYKIVLVGEAEFYIQTAIILESLHCFSARIKDETRAKFNLKELSEEYSLKGIFAKEILNQSKDYEDEMVKQALSYGLEALSGEKVKLP